VKGAGALEAREKKTIAWLTGVGALRKIPGLNFFPRFIPDFRSNHLANSPQALKRARQAEQHRQHNASRRSAMRTYIKNTLKAIAAGDKEAAMAAFKTAMPFIDRAAGKGLIHANKAARHKSRINARIKAMA